MDKILYKKRGEDAVNEEQVPGGGFLRFLYGNNPLGQFTKWSLVKRKFFTKLFSKYMYSSKSKKKIKPFIEEHNVDLNQFIIPDGGFKHFNDFFYRKVKEEYRPIGEGIISPADGRVLAFNNISETQEFYIKGEKFNIREFLNDDALAENYMDAAMVVVRLAPVDYHRYHFPLAGTPGESKDINGYYYSVSPLALRKNMRIFLENKRCFTVVENSSYGDYIYCDIAATLTGGMTQTYLPNEEVDKGDEKGFFSFGGSTVILLFKKGRVVFSEDLISNTKSGFETYLKMGETIGEVISLAP